ncbi:MAG: hypothetical protein HRU41_01415 [Saprospiraceae bacterium]|nr:hypothetical protein [Saprospiraceae bacterium]
MKSIYYLVLLGLVMIAPSLLSAQAQTAKKAKVMVLGTWHFNNPNQDMYNVKSDDVTTERRQKELEAVAEMLAKFKPTKIAIETAWQSRYDTLDQKHYQAYRKGEYTLKKGEDEQIGFRLAKKLGHPQIYCIDYRLNLPFDSMMEYAQKNGQMDILQPIFGQIESFIGEFQSKLSERTMGESLKVMNDPTMLDGGHQFYVTMTRIGKGKDYPGAEVLTKWYARNINIYANLTRVSTDPEDRILVIFGSGHAAILRELIRASAEYELVEAVDYL